MQMQLLGVDGKTGRLRDEQTAIGSFLKPILNYRSSILMNLLVKNFVIISYRCI